MDQDSIDRIRGATFTVSRRGYEKREVERFLGKIADWLEHGGGDESRADLVRRELERVGEKTARILTAAEDAAAELRAEAQQEAEHAIGEARSEAESIRAAGKRYDTETRSEADAYAERSRVDADTYSSETRSAAEADGERAIREARTEATRILDAAEAERAEVEAEIAELERHRDAVVADLERLASEVAGTATQHRPAGSVRGGGAVARGEGAPDESESEAAEASARERAAARKPG